MSGPRQDAAGRPAKEGEAGRRTRMSGTPSGRGPDDPRSITLPRMRRRIRPAAAFPFHRHSLPQVAVDAGLVALAYYLAFELRFDGDVPALYSDLFERTIGFVVVGSVFVFALFGLYRHWMRYATQRDYLQIAEACGRRDAVAARLRGDRAAAAAVRRRQRPLQLGRPVPAGVLVLYGLLMLVFIGGVALRRARALRAAAARLPRAPRRALGPDRRRRRRRPAAAARDHAQPRARLPARSASSTTTRASRARGSTAGSSVLGHDRGARRACSRTSSPTRC